MRSSVNSWWAIVLVVLIILSFAFASFFGSFSKSRLAAGVIAEVNGEAITNKDVSNRVQNFLAFYQSMGLLKGEFPPAMLEKLRNDVVNELIAQKIFAREAKQKGLAPSSEEVRSNIQKMFAREGQTFDFEVYKRWLERQHGKTPAAYEMAEGERLVAGHFQEVLMNTGIPSEEELRGTYKEQNTKAKISYVKLDEKKMTPFIKVAEPTEAQVKTFYDAHKAEFAIPEKRDIEVTFVRVADFLPEPTKEDLQATMRDKFKGEEAEKGKKTRWRASHILVRSSDKKKEAEKKAVAESLLAQLKAGKDFALLAKEKSEDGSAANGGDLEYFGPGAMVPEFEKAVATLKPGQISPVVKSNFGFHIIKLQDVIPEGELTVERLKPELTFTWRENVLSSGQKRAPYEEKAMKQIAESKQPVLVFKDITSNAEWKGLPEENDGTLIYANLDKVKEGETSKPIKSLLGKIVYQAKLIKKTPGKQPTLTEVAAQVKEKWIAEERSKARKTFYEEIAKNATKENKTLEAIASQYGLTVERTEAFTQTADGTIPGLGANATAATAIFKSTGATLLPQTYNINGEFAILRVDEKSEANMASFEAEKSKLESAAQENLGMLRRNEWLEAAKQKAKVKTALMQERN